MDVLKYVTKESSPRKDKLKTIVKLKALFNLLGLNLKTKKTRFSSNSSLSEKLSLNNFHSDEGNTLYLLHENIVVPLESRLDIKFTFHMTNSIFSLQALSSTSFTAFLMNMNTVKFSKAFYHKPKFQMRF